MSDPRDHGRPPLVHDMGEGANIVTDIPRYFIYKNGVKVDEVTDASEYWQDDFVGFLIGCSFSFEEALLQAGIDVRHISMGRNVPMYKTNIECEKAGVFEGPLVCSMRPMTPENAKKAAEITEKFPNVHGGPVHMGDPEKIGIKDIDHPDYGDPVEIREGEIPDILGLRRDPTGSHRAGEAADRHHPRPGSYVYHKCEERGVK